jgi:enamine deaminase RidA (YjgF/YER057c/UK114 family)
MAITHMNPASLHRNPAFGVLFVSGLGPPGSLVEIEAIAAVPAKGETHG